MTKIPGTRKQYIMLDWVNWFSCSKYCRHPGFAIYIDEMLNLFKVQYYTQNEKETNQRAKDSSCMSCVVQQVVGIIPTI